jgi:hypothetical protein
MQIKVFLMEHKLTGFLFFLPIFISLLSSCGNAQEKFEQDKAIQFMDSLDQQIVQVRNLIERIDIQELEDRKEFLYQELNIAQYQTEPLSQDDIKVYEDIRALSRIYRNALREYKLIVMETEELIIQLKTLRKSVMKNEYSKEEFKQYFSQEKEDVEKLVEYAETYLRPVVETDNLFERRIVELNKLNAPIHDKINSSQNIP